MADDNIEVRNVNAPDHVTRLDRAKFEHMREALLAVLPDAPPGMKVADAMAALKPGLDQKMFPGGAKAGWWMKSVQLDLEYHGVICRAETPPVRLYRVV